MMPMPHLPAITLLSLLHFLGAIAWCLVLLLSVAGYGAALLRLARLRLPGLTLSTLAGFGVALTFGGILNLLHLITIPILLATVAFGLLAGAAALLAFPPDTTVVHPIPPREPLTLGGRLLFAAFALVFAIRLGASVHTPYYQPSDDYNFYLAAPVKMLQTHIFGPDPFSERRVMSSVGGNHFLETLVLTELPLEDVQMADRALGLLLSALVAWALARAFQLSRTDTAVWALFVLATPQLQFNLTFVILPSALFLGMVYVATTDLGLSPHRPLRLEVEVRPWLRGLLLGLLAGAVTSLKSTYVVASAVFLVCFALLFARRSEGVSAALKLLVAAALAAFAVLLPWSIVQHTAAGTWFYPTLGLGFHYTRWGGFAPPGNHSARVILLKVLPFSLPPLAVFLFGWIRGRRDLPARTALSMILAAALATILVGIATGGDSVRRYNYPALLPGILLIFPVFCHPRPQGQSGTQPAARTLTSAHRLRRPAYLLAAAIAASTALYVGFNSFTWEYPWALRCLRTSLTDYHILPNEALDPAVGDATRARYQALEAAIPVPGANSGPTGTLETLTDPYLLDFSRRAIYLADVPGAASSPPGWPARQNGDALAKFLLAHGVRYLAYSYADGASETDHAAIEQTANPHNSQWIRAEAEIVLAAHHQYEDLGRTRRHLYDDGQNFLLDLADRTSPQ